MGNVLAQPQKLQPELLAELPNVVLKDTLGSGRFLKTLLCVHDEGGLVVVKLYHKRPDSPSLEPYKHQLSLIRSRLQGVDCPHVWPFQAFVETASAGYMMRQYLFANLYDRLSTRPFLTGIEKRWIIFQLLHALAQCHERGVCHGDIKCENVLTTSWHWVYLADFACFKPTHLPADNPAEYSFYFDTGGRRRCYIAPERFYPATTESKPQGPLTPEMDVFSLGCVFVELFMDGKAFMDLSQLLSYKRQEWDPATALGGLDADVRGLVLHMIQLDPAARWSARQYLTHWQPSLFPPYFEALLHPFFHSLLAMDIDARVAAARQCFASAKAQIAASAAQEAAAVAQAEAAPAAAAGAGDLGPMAAGAAGAAAAAAAAAAGAEGASTLAPISSTGPEAAVSLLDDVGALLHDAKQLQSRLSGPAGAAAAGKLPADDDPGFIIDEDEHEAAGFGAAPTVDAGSTAAGLAAVAGADGSEPSTINIDEVVTEDVYEYQVREVGHNWSSDPSEASSTRRKEDIALPAGEGGWYWADDWHTDPRCTSCDAEGWEYRVGGGNREVACPSTAARGWTPNCTDDCICRRRRWLRQRRRRLPASVTAPAAPVPAKLPARASPGAAAAAPGPAEAATGVLAEAVANGDGVAFSNGAVLAAIAAAAAPITRAGDGMVLMAVLLCTLLRGSKLQESKRAAMSLLCDAALLCDDDLRLQCCVPYLITLVGDPSASVRCLAIQCLVKVMCSVQIIPPSDAKVFQDYLIPSLSLLPNDSEEAVRVEYAQGIAHLAAAAHKHLARLQRDSNEQALAAADKGEGAGPLIRYDADLALLRTLVEKAVLELVTGLRSSAEIKRALLSHVVLLALFFGRRDLNDLLLPLLITCLNAGEWQLRSAFFQAVSSIGAYTGRESLDVFLLPCLEQALTDTEASVVADAVQCIASVSGYLRKRSLLAAARRVVPLLQHCSPAVRCCAIKFIASAARVLPAADVYTQLVMLLDGKLDAEPLLLSDEGMLAACLKQPDDSGDGSGSDSDDGGKAAMQTLRPHGAGATLLAGLGKRRGHHGSLAAATHGSLRGTNPFRMNPIRPTMQLDRLAGSGRPSTGSSLRPSSGAGGMATAQLNATNFQTIAGEVDTSSGEMLLRPLAPVYFCELDPLVAAPSGNAVSVHKEAVSSIQGKLAHLESRANALAERLVRDPGSVEALERQQLDRLSTTLARLRQPAGEDVRDPASLDTFRLAQLSTRLSPHPGDLNSASAAARLSQSLLQPHPGNYFTPSGVPAVSDAIESAISTGISTAGSGAGYGAPGGYPGPLAFDAAGPAWRPRGILLAHMMEHRKGVNQLAVARGGAFFVSASNDETVKVWDLRRLEKDVSFHSRLTYAAQSGRITAVAAVEDDNSVASASSAGSIHMWRVEYTSRAAGSGSAPDKYTGVVAKRQISPGLGSVLKVLQWGPHLLLYVSQRGGVHAWDLRSKQDVWTLPCKSQLGLAEHLVADHMSQHWLMTGSDRGYLTVWDVRFHMSVNSWQHPMRCAIDAMATSTATPSRLGIRFDGGCPLVYVAAGHNEVGLWDMVGCKCHQVIRCVGPTEQDAQHANTHLPGALQPLVLSSNHQHHTVLREPTLPFPTATASSHSSRSLDALNVAPGGYDAAATAHYSRLGEAGTDVGSAAASGHNLGVDALTTPQPRTAGLQSLLPLPTGQLITGSSDRCIRYWDGARPEGSYLVCGPLWPHDNLADAQGGLQVPQYRYSYSSCFMEDVPVTEERCSLECVSSLSESTQELRHKMRVHNQCHGDAITHMLAAEVGNRMLLTCSRDGGIKAWR